MRGRFLSAVAALPLALTLTLTGCGAGEGTAAQVPSAADGSGAKTAASAAPSQNPQEMGLKFAQCMRENGVDMADPEPGKPVTLKLDKGISEETMNKAQQACKQFSPMGLGTTGDKSQRGEKMRALAQCMRDNGVEEFPDPNADGALLMKGPINEDPDFAAAQKKCQMPDQGGS
ncbi:hypothetical protein [Streptosporangium sp. KLBMP 9127]|nr:hypothetical protein [Streptosporangium sp. KLBMP 9127]